MGFRQLLYLNSHRKLFGLGKRVPPDIHDFIEEVTSTTRIFSGGRGALVACSPEIYPGNALPGSWIFPGSLSQK